MEQKAQLNPFVKLALDFGPLILFFVVNGRAGIFWATAAFMAAFVVSVAVSYALIRRFPVMTLVTGAVVLVFGGLTIWLHDPTFVKLKTTIIYLLFAGVLAAGLILKQPFLEIAFDSAFHLTEEGWRILTIRWIAFFVAMAVVNEHPTAGLPARIANVDSSATLSIWLPRVPPARCAAASTLAAHMSLTYQVAPLNGLSTCTGAAAAGAGSASPAATSAISGTAAAALRRTVIVDTRTSRFETRARGPFRAAPATLDLR